jgi:hypothetical protein
VLVLGVLALAAARALRRRALDRRALALAAGFGVGTALWWWYGLAVDARAFVADHLRMHLAHRILLNDVRLTADPARYAPSIPELWAEFADHTGVVFLPVAAVALAAWLLTRDDQEPRGALAAWCIAGAVLYSLTDWRQTKHLMNGLAPLVAAAVTVTWPRVPPRGDPRWRVAARAVGLAALVVALALNLRTDAALLRDFRSLTVHGASDVDGW